MYPNVYCLPVVYLDCLSKSITKLAFY